MFSCCVYYLFCFLFLAETISRLFVTSNSNFRLYLIKFLFSKSILSNLNFPHLYNTVFCFLGDEWKIEFLAGQIKISTTAAAAADVLDALFKWMAIIIEKEDIRKFYINIFRIAKRCC